ncbi:MAG: hypothetical protein OXG78_06730 [Chloroflexi bacterium]|nr:hypothetical protein [Chloroflexota bacterium]
MDARRVQRHFVAVMAKHLPPSASTLYLLDLDGCSGEFLSESRADLRISHVPPARLNASVIGSDSVDAIVGFDIELTGDLLGHLLTVLRPGGRLIALLSRGSVSERHPRLLRDNGYVRILVEPALDGLGVLLRGEKPQATADTLDRIQAVAQADADALDLATYRGRYLHLLIQQRPNKPAWMLAPADVICWRAIGIERAGSTVLLAFSSLPKAVGFMQPGVLAGLITDVNKVGKFSRSTADDWAWDIVLNPTLESIANENLTTVEIDPATAEAPDE